MLITPKKELENLTDGSQQKVDAICDRCGIQYKVIYRNYIKSQKLEFHNNDGKTHCTLCARILGNQRRGFRKNCINYISNEGYRMIKVEKRGPSGNGWKCYRKEHVIVAEEKVNRKLEKHEVIHHIDHDKLNNSPDNLFICNGSGHMLAHKSLEAIGLDLFKLGLIYFDENDGKYYITENFRKVLENLK